MIGRIRCTHGETGDPGPPAKGGERGSGTLLVLTVVIFMLSLASTVGVFGRYILAGHRAAAAADLAALAGAQAYGTGQDGCGVARELADRNDQQLTDCSVVGDRGDFVLSVKISAPVPTRVPVLPEQVTATADAGPVR
jgi:secretion/DNA translocation related TadE-like protein